MTNRICRLAFPTQRAALDMPKDFSIFLFDADALIRESVEELGKCGRPRRQLCRKRQQAECHFCDTHLCAILSNAIIEAGTSDAESKPASAMRSVSMFEHLSEVCY